MTHDSVFNLSCFANRSAANLIPNLRRRNTESKELVAISNLVDIALVKSLLDSEGIPYFAQGEHLSGAQNLGKPDWIIEFSFSQTEQIGSSFRKCCILLDKAEKRRKG